MRTAPAVGMAPGVMLLRGLLHAYGEKRAPASAEGLQRGPCTTEVHTQDTRVLSTPSVSGREGSTRETEPVGYMCVHTHKIYDIAEANSLQCLFIYIYEVYIYNINV